MKKEKLTPRLLFLKAMQTYLENVDMIKVLNDEEFIQDRLNATAFGLKELNAMYGAGSIETKIDVAEKEIYILKNGIVFYVVDDYTSKDEMLYSFNIICQWGYILRGIEEISQQICIDEPLQTSFALVG